MSSLHYKKNGDGLFYNLSPFFMLFVVLNIIVNDLI